MTHCWHMRFAEMLRDSEGLSSNYSRVTDRCCHCGAVQTYLRFHSEQLDPAHGIHVHVTLSSVVRYEIEAPAECER